MAKHMQVANDSHTKAMERTMSYCLRTRERGLTLAPVGEWDGTDENFEFIVSGRSDSDYATDPETRRSVTGSRVSLNSAPVIWRSSTQKFVTLSVTEAEGGAAVTCVQDMLYVWNLLTSMELKVKLPMVLEMDNRGAVDLINSWSVGGRTRHVGVKFNWLRELKEAGIIIVKWCPGEDNDADMHTKNVAGPTFEKHARVYFGDDRYSQG